MADGRLWPALSIRAARVDDGALAERVSLILDDWRVVAIEDRTLLPIPPGGLWDPSFPPIPEPPPTPVDWQVFFEAPADRDGAAEALANALPELELASADVADEDWAARSQRELTAIRAGDFIVAPPWDLPADPHGATVIVIEPSMGFGTGHHPTTRLCLRALSSLDLRGKSALDVGTGSGVLAIAAWQRGATPVAAIDLDADAIAAAAESLTLNGATGAVTLDVTDFRQRHDLRADVVLANLTGGMLQMASREIRRLVAPGGTLVVSGFDRDEEPAVRAALAPDAQASRDEEETWVALVFSDLPPA